MTRRSELLLYLLLAFAAIPFFIADVMLVKVLAMGLVGFLIFRKDAIALPALVVLASFMSNFYVAYFAIIPLSFYNFKELKRLKAHWYFVILIAFLPVALYYALTNIFVLQIAPGPSFNQFQFYFSMFSFIYGVLIYKSFDKLVLRWLIIALFMIYLLQVLPGLLPEGVFVRMVFFIIPFLFGWLTYYVLFNRVANALVHIIFGFLILVSTFTFGVATFTLLFASALTIVLVIGYFLNNTRVSAGLTGAVVYLGLFLLLAFSIDNHKDHAGPVFREEMREVGSFDDFTARFSTKFFEDRGKIWAGTWRQVKDAEAWLPPVGLREITLDVGRGRRLTVEHHSHNLYLEFLRTNGYILGGFLALLFIKMNLAGRKILMLGKQEPKLILLTIVAIAGNLIGSFTGVYVLLYNFAILGLTLIGVSFSSFQAFQSFQKNDAASNNKSAQ